MATLLTSRTTTIVLIAILVVFGIHLISRAADDVRVDLTEDNLYSLSTGTEEILDSLRQAGTKPIEVQLYFAETVGNTLPRFIKDFVTYERYVRALLKEYAAASDGKISVRFIDPLPDSDEAQDALDYGLDGKAVNQNGDLFFFGLVFETQTGSRDVIEFLWPADQEQIEYEITKTIHRLVWPTRKKVGVMAGLEVLSDASNPYMAQILAAQGKQPKASWTIMTLLDEIYEVESIDPNVDAISHDDYEVVVLMHPKGIGQRALWALDAWVQTGGNLLVMVDPFSIADEAPRDPQNPYAQFQHDASSRLDTLLNAWGIEQQPDRIAADLELAVTRPTSRRGGAESMVHDLEINERTRDDTVATDHPVMQGVTQLRFYAAGSLRASTDDDGTVAGVAATPLVTTTSTGNTLEVQTGFPGDGGLAFMELESAPAKVRTRLTPGDEPVVLAYVLSGRLPSAFPEGVEIPAEAPPAPPPGLPPGVQMPPPADAEMVRKEPVSEDRRAESTVMVIADVDFVFDAIAFQNSLFGLQATNDNHRLFANAVDYLLGDQALMKVRAKQRISRPFVKFDEIEAEAARETQERERELRAELERFQQELDEKNRGLGAQNAALFEKQVRDEVEELNGRIRESNQELREIRLARRQALEGEETKVRFATLVVMPALVLALGLFFFYRRRAKSAQARQQS